MYTEPIRSFNPAIVQKSLTATLILLTAALTIHMFGTPVLAAADCPAMVKPDSGALEKPADALEETYGIRIFALRTTAAGRMLDLRYRVVDAEKAAGFLKKKQVPQLIHEPSETALNVPVTRLGPLRQTTLAPESGRSYFILFNAPPQGTHPGDTARVELDGVKSRPIEIEVEPAIKDRPAAGDKKGSGS